MTRAELDRWLDEHSACPPALAWMATLPGAAPWQLWQQCRRGEWLLWLAKEAGVPSDAVVPIAYRITDRAVRVHAADAMEAAGLLERAATLRSRAPVTDLASVLAAADVALTMAREVARASQNLRSAASMASAAARAAAAAALKADLAAWSASWDGPGVAYEAVRAAKAAGQAAGAARATKAAEHHLHAKWVREALTWAR